MTGSNDRIPNNQRRLKFGLVPSHLFVIKSNAAKNKMDAHPGRVIAYRNCFVRINGRKGSVRGRHAQSSNLHQHACLRDDSICFKRARPLPSTKRSHPWKSRRSCTALHFSVVLQRNLSQQKQLTQAPRLSSRPRTSCYPTRQCYHRL